MSALEFSINLSGNFATVLEKGNKGLEETEKHAKKASKEIELFEGEVGNLSGSVGGLGINLSALAKGGSLFTFDLAEGLRAVGELVERIVEGVVDLGKEMVKAAGDAQDLDLAIRLDVGDQGAESINNLAESFRSSRFSPKQIKESLLPLLEQGITDPGQLNDLTTAATDIAARRKQGIEGVQAALQAFGRISLKGEVNDKMLRELAISEKAFYKDLGGLLGVSDKQAQELAKQGRVKSQTLLSVALNQIQQREGGALGNATNKAGETLGATLARLGNLKDSLFEGIANSPGMHAIQGFLDNFIATMEGPIGTELVAKISDAFTTMFGDLSGPDGLAKMESAIKGLADGVKGFVDDFQKAWPDIKSGAEGVWEVMKGIAKTVATVVDGWIQIKNFAHDFDTGRINRDIIDTIKGDHGGIANDTVNENSPDWKKAKAAAGLLPSQGGVAPIDFSGIPQMASGGIVTSPTLALIGESGPEAVVPLGGGRGGGHQFNYSPQIVIQGSADRGAIEQAMHTSQQEWRVEMKKFIDEMGYTFGAVAA